MSLAIAVFASGGGSNLQALLDHFAGPGSEAGRISLVITDRVGVGALDRASEAGIEGRVIPVRGRGGGEAGAEILEVLRGGGIDLVVLAGYLSLVPAEVVREYRGRIVNIHPSLLPSFGGRGMYGLEIHRAVIEAGCRVSGVTIHLVDEQYDTGPIILQWPVPVLEGDTPERLAARVLRVEHRVFPIVVEHLARGGGEGLEGEDLHFSLADGGGPMVGEVWRVLGGGRGGE